MKKIFVLTCVVFTAVCGCTKPSYQLTDNEALKIILEAHKVFEKAVPAKDLTTIMTLYEEGAVYLPFQHVILKGKEEIGTAWERTFTYPVVSFDQEVFSVTANGNLIHEVGRTHSVFDFEGKQVPGEFKYINVWRRQPGGQYKIYLATYNQWQEPSSPQ